MLKTIKSTLPLIFLFCISSCSKKSDNEEITASNLKGEKVEIALSDKLDGLTSHYCMDIAGGNKNIDITKGLQAHTCYSYQGKLGLDQTFDTGYFIKGKLYMPTYDVCVTLSKIETGASLGLKACENTDLQQFSFKKNGPIKPLSNQDLCVTVSKETRFGRSKKHQIKNLSLQNCNDNLKGYQTWSSQNPTKK